MQLFQINADQLGDKEILSQVSDHYLSGRITVVRNFAPMLESELFLSLPSLPALALKPGSNGYEREKKFKKKSSASNAARLVSRSHSEYLRILASMQDLDLRVYRLFRQLFPSLSIGHSHTTWRFSDTQNEDYHADVYDTVYLRGFLNLSRNPRVWGIGHNSCSVYRNSMPEFIDYILASSRPCSFKEKFAISRQAFSDRVKAVATGVLYTNRHLEYNGKLISLSNKLVNSYVNKKIQGLTNVLHEFQTFDLWLCDSVKVCHQIVGGDKLAAFAYTLRQKPRITSRERSLVFTDVVAKDILAYESGSSGIGMGKRS
jgi:hypothetical protein